MGNNWISPLRRAIRVRDPEKVRKILIEAGEGAPDLINEDFTADCFLDCGCLRNIHSPLHTAMSRDLLDIVEILFQYGADATSTGLWNQTGLHRAGRQNNLLLAKMVVKYGCDLYTQDSDGRYPIHSAALSRISSLHGNVDVLRYFLEEIGKADDIHLKDFGGNTPLHCAAYWNNPLSAEYLLEKGANLDATNEKGLTPMDIAKSKGSDVKLVFERYRDKARQSQP